jgi:hypothetical protein
MGIGTGRECLGFQSGSERFGKAGVSLVFKCPPFLGSLGVTSNQTVSSVNIRRISTARFSSKVCLLQVYTTKLEDGL